MSDVTLTAMEKAKEMAARITRNKNALISIRTTLEVKRSALAYTQKVLKELHEDEQRLQKEVPALEHHVEQLENWCAKHLDSDEQVQIATELAKKIDRLRKELEKKRNELHRMESGLE